MPALDRCQAQVERALQKDGWIVTSRPKHFSVEGSDYYIDLELMRTLPATNGQPLTIFIEVKCFAMGSTRDDLYVALGQYTMYKEVLVYKHINTPLYLAVPEAAYGELFNVVARQACSRIGAKIIVFSLETEDIKSWIEF